MTCGSAAEHHKRGPNGERILHLVVWRVTFRLPAATHVTFRNHRGPLPWVGAPPVRKNCLYRGITHNQQPMNAPSSKTEILRAPEPRVKRAPNYKLLWPLALAPLFPAITIAFRNQPVWRTRLLFGTAAAVLVGAHHSGMTVGINSKEETASEKDGEPMQRKGMAKAMSPAMLQVAAVVACVGWMGVSSALIMINKYIMSTDGFAYPMALSCLGMLFSSVASYLACRVFKFVEVNRVLTWRFYLERILPVGLFMALTLLFGNVVYLYLTVSFIQMLKAFTPVITMVALFIARLEEPSSRLIVAVVLIALGTAMASYGEVNLSILGLIFMFASETFEAIRLVMTQILLVGLKFHPIEGLMHLAPACSFWLLLGVAFYEWPKMAQANALGLIAAKPLLYLAAAAMGFGVNSLAYIVIQLASSLTLKVLGTVKNALVVWMGIIFLAELVTPLQGLGYAVSVGGFLLYNYIKMQKGPATRNTTPTKHGNYAAVAHTDAEAQKGAA